jgi:hypothetical protein
MLFISDLISNYSEMADEISEEEYLRVRDNFLP